MIQITSKTRKIFTLIFCHGLTRIYTDFHRWIFTFCFVIDLLNSSILIGVSPSSSIFVCIRPWLKLEFLARQKKELKNLRRYDIILINNLKKEVIMLKKVYGNKVELTSQRMA